MFFKVYYISNMHVGLVKLVVCHREVWSCSMVVHPNRNWHIFELGNAWQAQWFFLILIAHIIQWHKKMVLTGGLGISPANLWGSWGILSPKKRFFTLQISCNFTGAFIVDNFSILVKQFHYFDLFVPLCP